MACLCKTKRKSISSWLPPVRIIQIAFHLSRTKSGFFRPHRLPRDKLGFDVERNSDLPLGPRLCLTLASFNRCLGRMPFVPALVQEVLRNFPSGAPPARQASRSPDRRE